MAGLSHQRRNEQTPQTGGGGSSTSGAVDYDSLRGNAFMGDQMSELSGGQGGQQEDWAQDLESLRDSLSWASGWIKDGAMTITLMEDLGLAKDMAMYAGKLEGMAKTLDGAVDVADKVLLGKTAVEAYNAVDRILAAAKSKDRDAARDEMTFFVNAVADGAGAVPVFGDLYSGVLSGLAGPLGEIAAEMVVSSRWGPLCEVPANAQLFPEECEALGYEVDTPEHPFWGPGVVDPRQENN